MVGQLPLRQLMHGNILVLTVSRILWSMGDSVVYAYFSLYLLSMGASKPVIGLINSVGALAACLLYPLGGYIADKAGRAKFVAFATLLYTSSFLVFAVSPSWEWLALAFMYQQIALFYMPALNAIMADSIPIGARGKIYALTIAIPEAVRIIMPYLGGYLISVFTLQPAMRLGYTISFFIGSVVSFIRYRYLKETIINREGIGGNIPNMLRGGYSNVFTSLRWMFSNIRGYALVSILSSFAGSLILPFWVVYANEIIGLTAYEWGVILLLGGTVKTLFSLLAGSLVDRLGSKKCIMIAFSLAIPLMSIFTMLRAFWLVAMVYTILVISSSFMWISSTVYLANSIPREMRGRIMAGLGSGMSIGVTGGGYSSGFMVFIPLSLGSMLSGFVYNLNPALPWYLQSLLLALAMILGIRLIHDVEKPQE
ncbi:MAG: MFS transporter [Candidatus Bathyarchaeia archaeon]